MMQLCGALVLFISVSTACGLRCFTCTASEPSSCTDSKSCAIIFNRCFTLKFEGYNIVTKGCQSSVACAGAMACCEGDLCNSATLTTPTRLLLLLTAAAVTLFL